MRILLPLMRLNYFRCHFLALSVISVFLISCKKDLPPSGEYVAQLWGSDPLTDNMYNELDLLLELTSADEHSLTFNNTMVFDKVKDSIQGTLVIANKDYLIHPYLIGTWTMEKRRCVISGQYGAVKDSTVNIEGIFEIRQNK